MQGIEQRSRDAKNVEMFFLAGLVYYGRLEDEDVLTILFGSADVTRNDYLFIRIDRCSSVVNRFVLWTWGLIRSQITRIGHCWGNTDTFNKACWCRCCSNRSLHTGCSREIVTRLSGSLLLLFASLWHLSEWFCSKVRRERRTRSIPPSFFEIPLFSQPPFLSIRLPSPQIFLTYRSACSNALCRLHAQNHRDKIEYRRSLRYSKVFLVTESIADRMWITIFEARKNNFPFVFDWGSRFEHMGRDERVKSMIDHVTQTITMLKKETDRQTEIGRAHVWTPVT